MNADRIRSWFRDVTLMFSAGALGGVANVICAWLFGVLGLMSALGVTIGMHLTKAQLYHNITWGGIWGVVFLLPFWRNSPILRGLIFGLGPSLVAMLVVLPAHGQGVWGLELGTLTPLFVLIFNSVWGVAASLWLKFVAER